MWIINTTEQIWGSHIATPNSPYAYAYQGNRSSAIQSSTQSSISGKVLDEKAIAIQNAIELENMGDDRWDPNTESATAPPRPFLLLHASIIAISMALVVFVEMLCVSKVRNLHSG